VPDSSFSPAAKELLKLLEEKYGGQQMPIIGNKMRWKAPWPMPHGNTVACLKHKDGSQTISAMGKAAQITREILGPEDQIKRMGKNSTEYSVWIVKEPPKVTPKSRMT
jgi:hypothetical protein